MMMNMQVDDHFFDLWCKNRQLSENAKYFLNKKAVLYFSERLNLLVAKRIVVVNRIIFPEKLPGMVFHRSIPYIMISVALV